MKGMNWFQCEVCGNIQSCSITLVLQLEFQYRGKFEALIYYERVLQTYTIEILSVEAVFGRAGLDISLNVISVSTIDEVQTEMFP